jgi:hypothetical protein
LALNITEIWQLRRREKAKAEIAGELYLFLTPYKGTKRFEIGMCGFSIVKF